jgi:hypothetical protein
VWVQVIWDAGVPEGEHGTGMLIELSQLDRAGAVSDVPQPRGPIEATAGESQPVLAERDSLHVTLVREFNLTLVRDELDVHPWICEVGDAPRLDRRAGRATGGQDRSVRAER